MRAVSSSISSPTGPRFASRVDIIPVGRLIGSLLSNDELLRVIVTHVPLAMWVTDDAGVVTFVTGHEAALGRINAKAFVGTPFEQAFADNPEVVEANRRALRGEAHRGIVTLGGAPFDAFYHPLRDPEGRIVGSAGVAVDISERQKTLADLRQSEEVTRRILEAVPAGIVLVSPEGSILDANRQAIDILGLSYDQLTHRYVQDFETETIWEDGSPFAAEDYPVSRCLATREAQPPATLGVVRPDGQISWCVFTAIPATHPVTQEFIGAVVTFHDITLRKKEEQERVRLERQLAESQKLEAIGRLAGGLAHDLNNILSAILGHASLLKEVFPAGAEEHEMADAIEKAGERAARLTNQLLGFARHGTRQSNPLDVDEILGESIDLLSGTMRKNIRITHRRAAETIWIVGDRTQLQQVMLNLSLNAQDAMPAGGDLVFGTAVSRENGTVVISVRDNGTGMPEQVQKRMFEPFYSTKSTGTGMGLALAYGIVKAHQGTIQAVSSVGEGTTFRITLPLSERASRETPMVEPAPERNHVLIVDDEEMVLSTTALLVHRLGWKTTTASNGAEAVRIYRDRGDHIRVVILDLVMPGMGGRECFRALRALDPEVRVIVSSGYDRDGIARDILGTAKTEFLQKPYTLALLRDALARALA